MPDKNKPLVSAAELEALIQGWGYSPNQSVDKFFPIRFWYLFGITFGYGLLLLFNSSHVAQNLSAEPVEVLRISRFLYFRGWFLCAVLCIGTFAYLRNWYPAITFSGIFIVGCVNFVFDLFNVYAEVLANPTPKTTVALIARLLALWVVFLSVRNAGRQPDLKDRLNILLPFKRDV
ncbi:hypothetical protein [uncultured Limnohabitans sp.]|jgi:hypothetical protein|uniref:hypothetical protein n=1 Tax=uncultured Limnohabitans sp. TaxID=768543 RepID=UPI002605BDBE|nr:hypothetical protein [uncultured Limnohabitans sp.]